MGVYQQTDDMAWREIIQAARAKADRLAIRQVFQATDLMAWNLEMLNSDNADRRTQHLELKRTPPPIYHEISRLCEEWEVDFRKFKCWQVQAALDTLFEIQERIMPRVCELHDRGKLPSGGLTAHPSIGHEEGPK